MRYCACLYWVLIGCDQSSQLYRAEKIGGRRETTLASLAPLTLFTQHEPQGAAALESSPEPQYAPQCEPESDSEEDEATRARQEFSRGSSWRTELQGVMNRALKDAFVFWHPPARAGKSERGRTRENEEQTKVAQPLHYFRSS
ncbi:hypothetical protein MRX96_042646 [Rhipicephalus microplus]